MIDPISEKIIRVLLSYKEPITSKKIAAEIGMSISSVKHNIDYTRQIIQSTGAILNSLPGKGFWLEGTSQQKEMITKLLHEHRDKSYSFTYRKNYILDILFKDKSNYTMQIFADDLGVGRHIIIKDLEIIEKWLTYFDLRIIKTRNKGVTIEGAEFDIRQAIMYNNSVRLEEVDTDIDKPDTIDYRIDLRFYNYFTKTYTQFDIFEIQERLQQVEKKLDFLYDDVSFTQLMEYIVVSIMRVRQGNIILEPNLLINCKITNTDFEAAKSLFDYVTLDVDVFLSIEIRCMAAQFALHGSYDQAISLIKEEYYDEVARKFIERLKSIIVNKNLLISEGLISDVGLFFQKKKMQKSYQMINGTFFRQDIKKQLPSLYGIVLTNIQPIETTLNVKFTENDIAYFVMLIDNAIEDTTFELNTLLITSHDYNTSKYFKNKIKRSVLDIENIVIVSESEVDTFDISNYDLILTTIPTVIEGALKISRHVGNEDLDLIRKQIIEIQKEKQEIIVKNHHLFDEKLIAINVNVKRKEDVIELGSKLLLDNHYVSEGFENVLAQRESITATSIGNGVAIPHGYRDHVLKSGVSVIVLNHPIEWTDEDKVDIIFLIAFDFETHAEIYAFFSQFYKLIDDIDTLNLIRSARDISEILSIIKDIGIIINDDTTKD